ncbi:transporter [Aequorivita sp. H23M31]|uniref:Transporter n=1 Tax=Aequorivita ciconiae TaxID=2494375 RepID=A0A410G6L3_9FLAO|nr:transporter [Aequorivita sp. H23M31]QAA82924.1 transporter [Aequorivita sp. H23M31]
MKKHYLLLLLSFFTIVGFSQNLVSPFQSGYYGPGNLGVRDLAHPIKSGLFVSDYNIFVSSDRFKNIEGDVIDGFGPVPFKIDISAYINTLMFTYASEKLEVLGGGRYMAIIAPSFRTAGIETALGRIHHDKGIDARAAGFGDLAIAPAYFSWELGKFDITAGYMFVAPTGRYNTGADDNIGLGYWSHLIQSAFYFYPLPQKATAIMVMPTYEFHGKIKDARVTPGSRLSMEYGVSQYFSPRFDLALQGGHIWQVGDDSGIGVYWDKSHKDKSNMFSIGAGYWLLPEMLYANLKWAKTYGERQNFALNTFEGQIVFVPQFKKKESKSRIDQTINQ